MPLLLPDGHPARAALTRAGVVCATQADAEQRPRQRIGVLNLMPAAEAYEPMLLAPLGESDTLVEPVFLRLSSHRYASSDLAHLDRFYGDAAHALNAGALDGLIVTGAPVEELAFTDVRYWSELSELLLLARRAVPKTLGLCWGAMAMAKLLGIEKRSYAHKLFGVYPLAPLRAHRLFASNEVFACAQSRHSGNDDTLLEQAARASIVRLLAHSDDAGYAIFESHDGRWTMHLGHPEYAPARLAFEYRRDRELARSDVLAPVGVDLEQPSPRALPHGDAFFAGWLQHA